jgi:hypothetical protein
MQVFSLSITLHSTIQVPICLAGSDTDSFLTAEPAIVVEDDIDDTFLETSIRLDDNNTVEHSESVLHHQPPPPPVQTSFDDDGTAPLIAASDHQPRMQHGVTVRRAVNKCRRMSMMNHTNMNAKILEHLNIDEKSVISPFDRSMSSRHMDLSVNCSSPPLSPTTSEHSMRSRITGRHLSKVDSGHFT